MQVKELKDIISEESGTPPFLFDLDYNNNFMMDYNENLHYYNIESNSEIEMV